MFHTYLFLAMDSFGVREGSEVFFCWNTKADINATASSGSRSSNWFSNKHSVQINSSPEFISQATRPLIWTTRSAFIQPISFKTSICHATQNLECCYTRYPTQNNNNNNQLSSKKTIDPGKKMSTRPWKSGICWSASSDIWNFRLLTSSLCFFISAANFRCSPNFIHPWHLLATIFRDMSVKSLYASTRFTSFNFKSEKEQHFSSKLK